MNTIGQVLDLGKMRERDRRPRRPGRRARPVGRRGQRDPRHRPPLRAPGRARQVHRPRVAASRTSRSWSRWPRRRATPPPSRTPSASCGRIKKSVESLEIRTLLNGEYDAREALVSIRSGAGGVDAADFAETLMRMYVRWAEQHKYPVEVYETSYAEEAGLKSATFAIHAPYAYGTLSVEAGTHRLVRISPFDNQGRRQTSASRPSRSCRCSSRPTRSRSPTRTSGSTSTAPAAPAASRSTRPTPRSG